MNPSPSIAPGGRACLNPAPAGQHCRNTALALLPHAVGQPPCPACTQPRSEDRAPAGRRRAFSLIEFVGVLAVISILAAAATGMVVNQMASTAVSAEAGNLANMNQALVSEVLHTCQIPGATNWGSVVGSWLMYPTTRITTNSHGFLRAYLYDTNGFGGVTLPYTQTTGLSSFPSNPRIMIVSSLDTNLPVASGGLGTTTFNTIWNTTTGNLPATWTNWPGSGANLVIQRINLLPLFKQLILSAVDTNCFGNFVVQSGTSSSANTYVLTNSPNNAWYLLGTVISLDDTNSNPSSPSLESKYVVQGDTSFVFEDRAWRGLLSGWGTNGPVGLTVTSTNTTLTAVAIAQTFTGCAHTFCHSALNSNDTTPGDSCQACQSCFDALMSDYSSWSQQGFTTGSWGNTSCTCSALVSDCARISTITQNLCQ